MEQTTGGTPVTVSPTASPRIEMLSTEVSEPGAARPVYVVHAPDEAPPLVPVISAWCRWHKGEVGIDHTIVVAVQESPSGPGWPIRCCDACALFHNIRPAYELSEEESLPAAVVAMFIGRRDGLPIAPGGSA